MLTHNGKDYARVSEIIQGFSKFPNLPSALANRERKAVIGTCIHEAISDWVQKEFPFLTKDAVPYFSSFLQWHAAVEPKIIETEERYFCDELMITGCVDALVKFDKDILTLVDFKCTAKEEPTTWKMQAHLYHYLVSKAGKTLSKKMQFIQLSPKAILPRVYTYVWTQSIHDKCLKAVDDFWSNLDCEKV